MSQSPSGVPALDQLLLDQSGELLLAVDPATQRIAAANRRVADLLGYAPGDLVGLPIAELESSLADVFYWEDVRRGQSGEVSNVGGLYRRRDGSLIPVAKDVRRVARDGRNWLVLRVRDEREHRRSEEAVAQLASQLKATIEASGDGILVTDTEGRIVNMNHRFGELWGIPEAVLCAGDDAIASWIDARVAAPEAYRQGMQATALDRMGESFDVLNLKDGRFFERRAHPQMIGDQVIGRVYSFHDITDLKRLESIAERERLRLQTILGTASDGIHILDIDGVLVEANEAFLNMLGYDKSLIGTQWITDWDAPGSGAIVKARNADLIARRAHAVFETRHRRRDGSIIEVEINASGIEIEGKGYLYAASRDISARKLAEQQLRIAATAFESQEGMIVTDADRIILRVNRAFTAITGYTADEAIGQTPKLLNSGRHDAAFYAGLWEGLRQCGVWQGEIWNRRKNGEVYPEWLTITAVTGSDGTVTHYVGTLTDITLRKAAEDEIKHLAFYDPLTRLPNRRLLIDRLQHALGASARSRRGGALLFIDLDNFKTLNDTLGHDVGDLLLQHVALRLSTCIREGDTVARLGGDEFVVMLEDLSEAPQEAATQAETVGEKISTTLNKPYVLAGHRHHSTPSIGATLFSGHQNSVDELMKRADLAMYQAKAAGRNTLRFFDPDMQAAVTARAVLESDLRQGLQQEAFLLYYQPQVDQAGRITGAEALVRWRHPQRGLMLPGDFIPLAEETGLIQPLGHWVLATACAQLVTWAASPQMAALTLAVNVSARQSHHPDFVDQVMAILDQSGADPRKLKLELTESLLLDDVEDIIAKMNALKAKGVGFALDDFGTGYSSLSYLKRLPLDQLKIDQSFVRDVLSDPNDAAIAGTIVALAQSMGLAVIAEGVESAAQRDFLAQLGCHAFQGYLFGRPQPVAEFDRRLADLALGPTPAVIPTA